MASGTQWTYHICTCRLPAQPAPDDSCTSGSACWSATDDHASLDSLLQCPLLLQCHVFCTGRQSLGCNSTTYSVFKFLTYHNWVETEMTGRSAYFMNVGTPQIKNKTRMWLTATACRRAHTEHNKEIDGLPMKQQQKKNQKNHRRVSTELRHCALQLVN